MATILGKLGTVKSGGSPADIGEITDFTINTSVVITADPSLGDDWATNKAGTKSWTGTVNANFDNADVVQDTLVEGAEVAMEFYPDTEVAGGLKLSGSAIVATTAITNGGNDPVVSVSFTFTGNGALTRADVV